MPTKTTTKNKPTLVAFLLDRSGSMAACKDETISGFNAYIKTLAEKGNASMRITLTQFDTQGVDIIHDAVPLAKVDQLTSRTYEPRGGTPLYDAMGKTIRETEAKAGAKFKVLFVTLTDGEENSSYEWNSATIRELIKEKEDKAKWTFAYIGVGLQGFAQTVAISQGTRGASNNLRSSHGQTKQAYTQFAGATACYARSVTSADCSVQNFWTSNPTTEDETQTP